MLLPLFRLWRIAPAVELDQLPKRFCLLAEQVQLVRPSFITFSESTKSPFISYFDKEGGHMA
jgi:hypothetical protein